MTCDDVDPILEAFIRFLREFHIFDPVGRTICVTTYSNGLLKTTQDVARTARRGYGKLDTVDMFENVDPSVKSRMSRTRSKDTSAELLVRRELHRRGFRYRVGTRPVPNLRRTGDIVFSRAKVVVLIDGCFWHRCPEHYVEPKTRTEFWRGKIAANVMRDRETTEQITEAGWTVLRFWEHEDADAVVDMIALTLKEGLSISN